MAKGKMSTAKAIKETLKKKKKKSAQQPPKTIDKSGNISDLIDINIYNHYEKFDLTGKTTDKETRFIYFYTAGRIYIEDAMILAGYKGYHPHHLYQLGKKIINKHECQADDHRKIFRAVGAGETAIAMGLLHLAENAKSEMVRLNAWTALAKCLGLTKEALESVEGIQIVINSSRGLAPQPQPGQHRPAQVHNGRPEAPAAPPGALQITR
jgi:hypothetical protein